MLYEYIGYIHSFAGEAIRQKRDDSGSELVVGSILVIFIHLFLKILAIVWQY